MYILHFLEEKRISSCVAAQHFSTKHSGKKMEQVTTNVTDILNIYLINRGAWKFELVFIYPINT